MKQWFPRVKTVDAEFLCAFTNVHSENISRIHTQINRYIGGDSIADEMDDTEDSCILAL